LASFLYTFHTKRSFSPLFAGSRLAFSATILISAVFVDFEKLELCKPFFVPNNLILWQDDRSLCKGKFPAAEFE
jgi:hypothetical protein